MSGQMTKLVAYDRLTLDLASGVAMGKRGALQLDAALSKLLGRLMRQPGEFVPETEMLMLSGAPSVSVFRKAMKALRYVVALTTGGEISLLMKGPDQYSIAKKRRSWR